MEQIFLLLGSNLGERERYLTQAVELIGKAIGKIELQSSYYVSPAWGVTNQPDFINQVVSIKTSMPPAELLQAVLKIEAMLDRVRKERWGPRTIDIDILFYGSEIVDEPDLVIPHKLLHERRFALTPLCELAPYFIHPVFNKSIEKLLSELTDDFPVIKMEKYH